MGRKQMECFSRKHAFNHIFNMLVEFEAFIQKYNSNGSITLLGWGFILNKVKQKNNYVKRNISCKRGIISTLRKVFQNHD